MVLFRHLLLQGELNVSRNRESEQGIKSKIPERRADVSSNQLSVYLVTFPAVIFYVSIFGTTETVGTALQTFWILKLQVYLPLRYPLK
jgi:hypothetical protein